MGRRGRSLEWSCDKDSIETPIDFPISDKIGDLEHVMRTSDRISSVNNKRINRIMVWAYLHRVRGTRPGRYENNALMLYRPIYTLLAAYLVLFVRVRNAFEAGSLWGETMIVDQKGFQNTFAVRNKASITM